MTRLAEEPCGHCALRAEIGGRPVLVRLIWDHLEKVAASSERGCILYRCPVCGTFWEECAYEPGPREVDEAFVWQHYPLHLEVADAFELSEGLLVLVGRVTGAGKLRVPCLAELFVNGLSMGSIEVLSERMPGPALPRDHHAVETALLPPHLLTLLRQGQARLVFSPAPR